MKTSSFFGLLVLTHGIVALLLNFVKRSRKKYDGLDSVVSFSSRMIAAARAVETSELNALVRDPLSLLLAGKQAYARSTGRAKEAPPGRGRSKLIGLMAIRTRWFDDQVLAALGLPISKTVPATLQSSTSHLTSPDPAQTTPPEALTAAAHAQQEPQQELAEAASDADGISSSGSSVLRSRSSQNAGGVGVGVGEAPLPYVVGPSLEKGNAPRQVVLLGAGMDSRPWRLDLPEGVRWFEVDRQDVLQAKKKLLGSCGAEIPPSPRNSQQSSQQSSAPAAQLDAHQAPQGIALAGGSNVRYAGSRENDGTVRGTACAYPLRAATWEGVSCDLCSPSWTGELVAAGFDPGLPTVWVAEGLLMYLTREEVEALLKEMAGASAAGSRLVTVSVTETVVGIKQRGSASELLGTWKFGCPVDPSQFLGELGWHQELALTRGQTSAALNLDPELCAFQRDDSSDPRSLFLVASVQKQ